MAAVTQRGNQPPVAPPAALRGDVIPDRLYVFAPGVDARRTRQMSADAVRIARQISPKLSGSSARGIKTYYGDGFFGLRWDKPYLWWQERGTRPRTMTSLANKTIPMWLDDPTGSIRAENPKAETRTTASGKRQTLLFRKAAKIGARKTRITRRRDGSMRVITVPRSYPGAPGRIASRQWEDDPGGGRATGRISSVLPRRHIGVRWRHPGIHPREFLQFALQEVGAFSGLRDLTVQATFRRR